MRLLEALLLIVVATRPVTSEWLMEAQDVEFANLRGVSAEVTEKHLQEGTRIIEKLHAVHESMQEILIDELKKNEGRPTLESAREVFEQRMGSFTSADFEEAHEKLLNVRKEKSKIATEGNVRGEGFAEAQNYYGYYELNSTIEVYAFRSHARSNRSVYASKHAERMAENVHIEGVFSDVCGDLRDWEFHTFDISPSGRSNYVRGTYGMFGYFEGVVTHDNGDYREAYVNWFQSDQYDPEHRTYGGAAVLHYYLYEGTEHHAGVYGRAWSANSAEVRNNWWWVAHSGFMIEDDGRIHPEDVALLYSFYDVNNKWSGDTRNPSGYIFDSLNDRGQMTFMSTGVGSPMGSILGGYAYKYSPKECRDFKKLCAKNNRLETGHYGNNILLTSQASATLMNGFWHARTGPFSGDVGTTMYAVLNYGWSQLLLGYYCDPLTQQYYDGYMAEEFSYGYEDNEQEKGGCYLEIYWMQDGKDFSRVKKYMSLNRGNVRMLKNVIKAIY